ncbi:hypothetical protein CEXT_284791 [Caerostris extrusa]|uniref:Uncharacterized protein n=1 Tax=Caerostris extrusa TaxID=172846 RepID=A0AAV4XK38_CAEEX|nr:hypothetical protein CEXT_284791 [Caerostris extrusa]
MKSSKVKPPEGRRNRFIKKSGSTAPSPPLPKNALPPQVKSPISSAFGFHFGAEEQEEVRKVVPSPCIMN